MLNTENTQKIKAILKNARVGDSINYKGVDELFIYTVLGKNSHGVEFSVWTGENQGKGFSSLEDFCDELIESINSVAGSVRLQVAGELVIVNASANQVAG